MDLFFKLKSSYRFGETSQKHQLEFQFVFIFLSQDLVDLDDEGEAGAKAMMRLFTWHPVFLGHFLVEGVGSFS